MTKLASQKVKINGSLKTCEKCGSIMVSRILIMKNGKGTKKQKVYQCIVCRHWTSQD